MDHTSLKPYVVVFFGCFAGALVFSFAIEAALEYLASYTVNQTTMATVVVIATALATGMRFAQKENRALTRREALILSAITGLSLILVQTAIIAMLIYFAGTQSGSTVSLSSDQRMRQMPR